MTTQRKIIHIDCDCFYAAVEMRDQPELRTRPIAIGGAPGQRGVISTCNYVARQFGIHSAMPTSWALRQCPQLVLLPHDFARYKDASQRVQAIFRDYTERIEPLSLDEAYLDVSGLSHCQGSATLMAQEIRARIASEVGITASAGIAPNKLLAKIASDWNKPDGQFVITPDGIDAFMPSLPIAKLWGIGKVTAARLARHGLILCGDAQRWPLASLEHHFGRLGSSLYRQCRGIDDRPVETEWQRKSLSVEHTYAQDLPDLAACLEKTPSLYIDLSNRLHRHQGDTPSKAFVKIKFHDFTQTTMECSARNPDPELFKRLLTQAWQRGARPVRLLGVGVRFTDAATASSPSCAATPHTLPLWPHLAAEAP
ncbi:DNA polymerase IV [Chitinilyticum piscinae]|uniref:DNA polymerase IV n=1 Tax=Chitinilyticum piscinae TaxID=2866724 RepID=A0A8J7FF40_9NEIS|nr:DNA polymerase IV [Chitinilyticum piscinae]MBE9608238.1 DNA polymerase IV [Chitinilyticum piscinae]